MTEKLESVTPTVNVKTYSSLGNSKIAFTLTNNQKKNDIFVVNELNPYKGGSLYIFLECYTYLKFLIYTLVVHMVLGVVHKLCL